MNKILLAILILLVCSCSHPRPPAYKVSYQGALKNIMHKGDLSAQQDLSEYAQTKNLYALGAMENLKGEIQIFNSQAYHSMVVGDRLQFDTSYAKRATLFVSSVVANWTSFPIPKDIHTKDDLETYVERIADENNIDTDEPFPFLIEGKPAKLDWHVINWPEGDTEHTHEKHIQSGLHGTLQKEEVVMLGFYSDSHHAIFTHHTTNMHIHMKRIDGSIAGHVDDLVLGQGMVLRLPEVE